MYKHLVKKKYVRTPTHDFSFLCNYLEWVLLWSLIQLCTNSYHPPCSKSANKTLHAWFVIDIIYYMKYHCIQELRNIIVTYLFQSSSILRKNRNHNHCSHLIAYDWNILNINEETVSKTFYLYIEKNCKYKKHYIIKMKVKTKWRNKFQMTTFDMNHQVNRKKKRINIIVRRI